MDYLIGTNVVDGELLAFPAATTAVSLNSAKYRDAMRSEINKLSQKILEFERAETTEVHQCEEDARESRNGREVKVTEEMREMHRAVIQKEINKYTSLLEAEAVLIFDGERNPVKGLRTATAEEVLEIVSGPDEIRLEIHDVGEH